MDSDVDRFSVYFPLPYRIAIICVLGVWAWGANLDILHKVKIDVPSLIRYSRTSPHDREHHESTYRVASLLSLPLIFTLILTWMFTHGNSELVEHWSLLPNLYLIFAILIFLLPLSFARSGRSRFVSTLRRISIGGLAQAEDGKFGDILMADALTSYAKVMADIFITLCMSLSGKGSSTSRPDRACGGPFIAPFIVSIPTLIRFRQCLIEYVRERRSSKQGGGRHLANAAKYATALPVIILSQVLRSPNPGLLGLGEGSVFSFWLLAMIINSVYSFWWDVTNDWDLTLLLPNDSQRGQTSYPWGLRQHRHFRTTIYYYAAIAMDFCLRFLWSLNMSRNLDQVIGSEGVIYLFELLEVFRRWVWVFFRVETEWVRQNGGNAPLDIPLSRFPDYRHGS